MFQVGDIVSHYDHLAEVTDVDYGENLVTAVFLDTPGWEWWFGDTYENIVNDYGTDLEITFNFSEVGLVSLAQSKTWEDML
jgi:hypothetical protein